MGDKGNGRGKKEPATRPKQPTRGRGRVPAKYSDKGGQGKNGVDKKKDKLLQPKAEAQGEDEKKVKKKVNAVIKQDAGHKVKQADVAPIYYCEPRTKIASSGKDKRLKEVVENIKLKMKDISTAAVKVNTIVDFIIAEVSMRDELFQDLKKLTTGSYYEKVKISNPNEFDIMLEIRLPENQRVKLTEFGSSGAFYTLTFERKPRKSADFLDKYVDDENISAKKILSKFRLLVKNAVAGMPVSLQRRSPSSPAITLIITNRPSNIAVDLVLALEIRKSWPQNTREGMDIGSWLGTKVKNNFRFQPFYMVPKQCNKDKDSITKDTWRISFSHIEKQMLTNHGSNKTCCETEGLKCCRKRCLKLMKHLLERLKTKQKGLDQFCSYFAKTALLHQCVSYPKDEDWKLEDLDECFNRCIEFFQTCLENSYLSNFFIPSHNLLSGNNRSCGLLYKAIEEQKKHNYPLFNS